MPRPRKNNVEMAVDPNPAKVGEPITITAKGLEPNSNCTLALKSPYAIAGYGGPTDSSGTFTTGGTIIPQEVGEYTASVYQKSDRRPDATLEFEAVA